MNEFYRKLAKLSPERRALFEKKLLDQGLQPPERPAAASAIPRRPAGLASLPLSFAQQRLWFMQQLDPENIAYNMVSVLRLKGPLDRAVLGAAVEGLVARHEPLRTRFALGPGNEPQQIIEPAGPVAMDVADLEGEPDAEATARQRIEATARAPFDLSQRPLRVVLLRLAAEGHLLAIVTHHIAGDRWSLAVFVRELSVLYRAGLREDASPLPALPVQYVDWALWQRETLQGERLQAQLDYWTTRLGGELPLLELPFDRPRGATASFRGAHFPVSLDPQLSIRLRELARRQQVSLFTLLLAGFKVLLHRYADSDDIIVGSDVANRDRAETQGMIGPLVNTLVLRSDLSGDPSFETLLKQVHEVVRGGLAHQDVPFERVVEAVNPTRRMNEMAPLFQAKFDFQHVTIEPAAPGGLALERYPLEERSVKFELRFNLEDRNPDIGGKIEYCTDLFDEATIARLARHFETLLAAIAADPGKSLAALPLMSEAEERAILAAGRGPALDAPEGVCIHNLFEAQAARSPDAPAVTDGRITLTYGALNAQADAVAAALAGMGAGAERCVGVFMRRTPRMVAALLGVLKAGAAYVPLDPDYPAERLSLITEDARLDIVIADGTPLPFAMDRPVTLLDPERLPSATTARPAPSSPDNLAYIIYTSGSTGRPKGVALEHRNAVARLLWARDQFPPEDLAGVLAASSISFDLSVFEIFAPLAWGGQVILAENLLALPRLPDGIGITLLNSVPSLLRELVKHHELPPGLRTVTLAGETFPTALLDTLQSRYPGVAVFNLWGPSEDTTFSSCTPVSDYNTAEGPLPIGGILPGTQLTILDRAGRLLPKGAVGEIHLSGAGLGRGYLDSEALTREKFLPNPFPGTVGDRLYRTGDRGRWRTDGLIDFAGRVDNQVKVRGFRIETGEIEHTLEQLPEIHQAAVVVTGQPGDPDRQLIAYVVPRAGAALDEAELRDRLARTLPAHLVPARLCALAQMPVMPNGKVDRQALPALMPLAAGNGYAAPRNETEARLAQLWAEALGMDRVGIEDNFFELGGHSLLAIQIIARIEAGFGVALPLKALFQNPTVAGLARELPEHKDAQARTALVPDPAARFEPFPLTDIQHAYWLGRNRAFELGSVGSHSYREFDVTGLDIEAAEAAFQRLIARHDMLRAVVLPDGSQRVIETVEPYRVPVADLRGASDSEAQLSAIRERLSHHVFAPDRWPLFHIEAARLDEQTVRLFVSFDVLIGDAWSFQLIGREFAALMAGEDLPPLGLSFRDYVLAERAHEQSAAYAKAMAHWKERIETLPPPPELPLIRTPDQIETPRFRRRRTELAAADWTAFKARASAAGLTPTSAVLAAFAEVLARWSRRPGFTLNLTLFNRPPLHADINQIVGDFTASLLLGVDMSGIGGFGARAQRLQDRLWADLDHRAVSGVRVLRELTRRQNRSRATLMPVVFTSTLNQVAPEGERRFKRTLVDSVSQTPQVYLDHQASEIEGALVCNWDAIEELFPSGLLDTMFAAYEGLLTALARDDAAWASAPDLGGSQHFDAPNRAAVLPLGGSDLLLHTAFFAQADANPDRIAVFGGGVSLTYGEVAGRALALAAQLQASGAAPNQLIAVSLERGAAQIIACLGVLAAGAAYVPIDPDLPRERRWQLIDDIQARLVVCAGGDWPEGLCCVAVPETAGPRPQPAATQSTDLAYVIFTSGSTGRPKGVMIDHRGALNTVLDINRRFAIGRDDRVFAVSSLSFDLSVYDIFGPLAVGGAVVVPDAVEAANTAHWRGLLARHRVTVWNSVPALAQLLVTELGGGGEPLPLRLIMLSGDWIPVSLPRAIGACLPGAELISLGGATEASVWSIYHPIKSVSPDWTSIPYGVPLANQRWYVLDDEMRVCAPWVTGRLFIGGVGVARGYWARPALTAEKFLPDPFATREDAAGGALYLYDTGDLGRSREGGVIEFLGRQDFQLKINGFRIEPGEIEAALLQHPAVAEAVVAAAGTPPSLIAYVVPRLNGGEVAIRLDLKAQQAGLRPAQPGESRLALPEPDAVGADWVARQSHRRFLPSTMPLETLGGLLAALRSVALPDAPLPKYGYPSAGSLYPVQTYVWVAKGRVAGLDGGWHYHHPARHDLVVVAPGRAADIDALAGSNAGLIGESAFALAMVASMRAVADLYGEWARDFCMLEAGYMGQLLMTRAPALHLGLCPLGGIDMAALGQALHLDGDHLTLHALCGGAIEPSWNENWQAVASTGGIAEKLSAFLSERLPAHMVPRDIMLMGKLPLTANGKVDRQALPRPDVRQRAPVAPATPAEKKVLDLWRELLDAPDLGVEDHFFEAGGNSLTAMRLLTRLQQEFAVELSIAQLFGALTPRTQAALVAAGHMRPAQPAIQAVARHQDTASLPDSEVDDMLARLLAERKETAP